MREIKIEKYLIKMIEKKGGMALKFPPLFFAGFPDRIVLLPKGVAIFVELKRPGAKPRKIQERVHSKLRGLGFRVDVLSTLEEVENFIKEC